MANYLHTQYRVRNYHRPTFWLFLLACLLTSTVTIYAIRSPSGQTELVINELMALNQTTMQDEDGDFSDWLELHNRGSRALNLAQFALTDDPAQPRKWPLPEMTLRQRQYLLLFASGKDRTSNELHTNFRLNQQGEFLGLYSLLDNRFVDQHTFATQQPDIALSAQGYLPHPTPGQPNDTTAMWPAPADSVSFSVSRGFYEQPFTLMLSSTTPHATIHYTTDGSQPTTEHGQRYEQPLSITRTQPIRAIAFSPQHHPSPVTTHSYIFLADILRQPRQFPHFPERWGVLKRDSPWGHPAGSRLPADYALAEDILTDPEYGPALPSALQSLPALSLVMEMSHFSELYRNTEERGRAWERPVSVEWFNDGRNQTEPTIQANAGLRIQGGRNRSVVALKHSFRLFFRGEYGPTRLDYPLYPNSPVTEFDTLVLRGGSSESFTTRSLSLAARWATAYTRDEWLRRTQQEISGFGAHGRFAQLFINGMYWGLYNLVERPDEEFLAAYLGGEPEEWLVKNHRDDILAGDDRLAEGYRFISHGNMADPTQYAQARQYIDIEQFIDYLILNWYAGNKDWPDSNWYVGMRLPDGQAKFLVWDGEVIWVEGPAIHFGEPQNNLVTPLFEPLMANPDFRQTLADRLYQHLHHAGPLTDANAQARWTALGQQIEQAIIGESARWGDAGAPPSITRAEWLQGQQYVLRLMDGSAAKLLQLSREHGFYPPFDPPQFSQHGGPITAGRAITLTTTTPGDIFYTVDGTDPRHAPSARRYTVPVVLTQTTRLKTRLRVAEQWSALNQALFQIQPTPGELRLTELMYHPPQGKALEFVELQNVGHAPVELAGIRFTEGIRFTFAADTPPLPPRARRVLVSDPAAFSAHYPHVPISGQFTGHLANEGERLTLRHADGRLLLQFTYADHGGWPLSADGRGDSLELISATAAPTDPSHWRASKQLGGSPGQ